MATTTTLWIVRIIAVFAAVVGIVLLKAKNSIGWVLVAAVLVLLIYHQTLTKKAKAQSDSGM